MLASSRLKPVPQVVRRPLDRVSLTRPHALHGSDWHTPCVARF